MNFKDRLKIATIYQDIQDLKLYMIKTLFALIIFVNIAQKGMFLKTSAYKKWRYLLRLTVLKFNLEYFELQINSKLLIGYLKLDF